MIEILFEWKLVSINKRYISRGFHLSPEYRQCKELLKITSRNFYHDEPLTCPIGVSIKWDKGRMDLDACIKIVLDSLQGEIYVNDSQIQELKLIHAPKEKTIIKIWKI